MTAPVRDYAALAWRWWCDGVAPHDEDCLCLPCSDLRERFTAHNPLYPTLREMRLGATNLGCGLADYRAHVDNGEKWCSGHGAWEPIACFGLHLRRGLNTACADAIRASSRRAMQRLRRRQEERRTA